MPSMTGKGPEILFCGLMILTGGAAAAIATGASSSRDQLAREREFHRLVGGLGSGPAVDLSRCPFSFDVRLADGCRYDQGPIPGGVYFCPEHGCSILYCKLIPETREP